MSDRAVPIQVENLHAYYGESHILHGLTFEVRPGEVVALLGRNGGGRTTTLRAIMGLVDRRIGSVRVNGVETIAAAPFRIARLGLGYCPEERGIFASLSCEENLVLPPAFSGDAMSLSDIYDLFPNLEKRRKAPGTRLSGGEQQMLAIARILRTGAKTLLLDEISEGLAPVIVDSLFDTICKLRERDYTILLVEQNLEFAAPLADRFLVVERGTIALQLSAAELDAKTEELKQYLGV
jgi:branched-chain amino acid transport system ATP-binding protein